MEKNVHNSTKTILKVEDIYDIWFKFINSIQDISSFSQEKNKMETILTTVLKDCILSWAKFSIFWVVLERAGYGRPTLARSCHTVLQCSLHHTIMYCSVECKPSILVSVNKKTFSDPKSSNTNIL